MAGQSSARTPVEGRAEDVDVVEVVSLLDDRVVVDMGGSILEELVLLEEVADVEDGEDGGSLDSLIEE
jgi:hypothetical protein